MGVRNAATNGSAAPSANIPAEAKAAWTGRADRRGGTVSYHLATVQAD